MDYIQQVLITESPINFDLQARLTDKARLLHAAMGLCTESGEFMDALKRHVYYNAEFDCINAKEEIGDILWYLALALDELGLSFEEVMEANIAKLKKRYYDKFSEEAATERDLQAERLSLAPGFAVHIQDVSTDGEVDYLFSTDKYDINLRRVVQYLSKTDKTITPEDIVNALKSGWRPTAAFIIDVSEGSINDKV